VAAQQSGEEFLVGREKSLASCCVPVYPQLIMETQVKQPVQENLPRLTYETPTVVDYGNAAEITGPVSIPR
jgi:hypothetical protein